MIYSLNTCVVCNEDGEVAESYGITSKNKIIKDVSTDKNKMMELIKRCNELDVSEIHIKDIVEDFLVNNGFY